MVAPDRERLRKALGGGRRPARPQAADLEAGRQAAAPREAERGDHRSADDPGDGERDDARAELRAYLQRREAARRARPQTALPDDGEVAANEHGPFWRRLQRYPLGHLHGRVPLGAGTGYDPARLAALARGDAFGDVTPQQMLFVDTETTGLGGGAGTIVFAVGLGWFEADAFVFEQLFLRDFAEEPALLWQIAVRLGAHPVPVSFVGKSFDRHRIAARLAVHRIEAPILTDLHLDLYYLSRRAWKGQLDNFRLRTVEEQRLGLFRDDDLPGSEAPLAFFDWIRDGSGPVDRVLEHNRLDVLSLAALLGVITGV